MEPTHVLTHVETQLRMVDGRQGWLILERWERAFHQLQRAGVAAPSGVPRWVWVWTGRRRTTRCGRW